MLFAYRVIYEPVSAVPINVGVESVTIFESLDGDKTGTLATDGAVVSMVTTRALEVVLSPLS